MDELLKQCREALAPFARQDIDGMISPDELRLERADFSRAREVLALLDAALLQPRDAGEGFVLVPKEPTEEMCHAGEAAMSFRDIPGMSILEDADESTVYRAMLAAAPPSPSPAILQPEESQ